MLRPPPPFSRFSVILSVGTSTSNITLSTCGTALYCNFTLVDLCTCICKRKHVKKILVMLLQRCGEFDSVSDERLELKSHSSLYVFPFFFGWGHRAISCLLPEPLTPSTSVLWLNHVIKLYKPNGKKSSICC